MVDAIVSDVLKQLISMAVEEAKEQVRLVTGVEKEVKRLQDNFEAIQAVVVDAEQRQVKEAPVRLWLENLKDVSYDMDDVLDEWITARLKLKIEGVDENALCCLMQVCSSLPAASCFGFQQIPLRRDIALNIKAIDEKLVEIARQKDMFHLNVIRCTEISERVQSTALINVSEVVPGRDKEKETLKSKLLSESSQQQNAVQIISLIGMGGIGKTTLAQFAYNDIDVKNSFDQRMWVCVSDPFDEFKIAKAIIEALEGSATNLRELNALLLHIHASIAGKKFLLVLDDVWTEDSNKWEPIKNCLMNGLRGSKILVTTRKETVAKMMKSIDVVLVKEMSEPECVSLFRDEEKKTLKIMLLSESSEQQNAVQIISLIGMGGIGKTTLAQFAYNDIDVINSFDQRMWVCVSDPFDEFRIAKAIIEALEGSATNLGELNSLLLHIHTSIERKKFLGKKFLLVLDDVWTEDRNKWEPFHNCLMNGLRGSKILVTTRKETVAQMMESIDVVSVKEMSEPECISMFERFAFFGRSPSDCEQLKDIGRKIVFKCKGLPLAVKTIGSLLRFKRRREEWQSILESEMWQLEEFERGLLPPLLLSYNDLPSVIKRCFSYCVVFPKDHNIEKDELIQLWMAQGYIRPKENKELEMIGDEYFDYLATRSFFQEFDKDEMGNVLRCKMHDIVHDFSQFLTKNECVSIKVEGPEESLSLINSFGGKLRHSMLVLGDNATFPISVRNAKKLRSLLIHIPFDVLSVDLHVLFNQFTCLRTLSIFGAPRLDLRSVPQVPVIENLMRLRFLGLYDVTIEELPEIYCELFNLQTLIIFSFGGKFKRLPEGIGKLINLRHLLFTNSTIEYMPKGIGKLINMRTLSEFVVGSESKYGSKSCNLEGLRNLNHLRGGLRITGLGNVADVDEAKNAHLEEKKNLVDLELSFGTEEENEVNHEAIGEALRPHANLESLQISEYEAMIGLPSWIVTLNKLKKIVLRDVKCEIMPQLGKLPCLEILWLSSVRLMNRRGGDFLGIEDHATSSSSSSSSVNYIAFPKLKLLMFELLPDWEEWDIVGKEDIIIMPQLNSLKLLSCYKLKSLPDQILRSITLKELEIYNCGILRERFRKDRGEDWSKICLIPNIQIDFKWVQGKETNIDS